MSDLYKQELPKRNYQTSISTEQIQWQRQPHEQRVVCLLWRYSFPSTTSFHFFYNDKIFEGSLCICLISWRLSFLGLNFRLPLELHTPLPHFPWCTLFTPHPPSQEKLLMQNLGWVGGGGGQIRCIMGNMEVANKNECATRNEYAHDEYAFSFLSVISSTGVHRVFRFPWSELTAILLHYTSFCFQVCRKNWTQVN